ncbi:MAG: hypothetical protein AAF604_08090 [Acidobacteriota bacterium]
MSDEKLGTYRQTWVRKTVAAALVAGLGATRGDAKSIPPASDAEKLVAALTKSVLEADRRIAEASKEPNPEPPSAADSFQVL